MKEFPPKTVQINYKENTEELEMAKRYNAVKSEEKQDKKRKRNGCFS